MTTRTTSAVVAPIAMIFSVNEGLLFGSLDGLSNAELWRPLTDRNNAILWIAGHVVEARASILQLLGEPFDTGWGGLFDRGATVGEAERYPSGDVIRRVMGDVGPRLLARLASLDDEYLARPATMQLPGAQTLADQLAFFALHDSYHIGQMAYVRKALGYPGLVG